MKVVSLILRASLIFVASLLLMMTPANAQTITQLIPGMQTELVCNQPDVSAMQPLAKHRTNFDSHHGGCNCLACTQAQLLLTGKLPLSSLI